MTHSFPRRGVLLAAVALLVACGGRNPYREDPLPAPALTGDTITAEEIANRPGESIEEMLRGRISGVWVTRGANGALQLDDLKLVTLGNDES